MINPYKIKSFFCCFFSEIVDRTQLFVYIEDSGGGPGESRLYQVELISDQEIYSIQGLKIKSTIFQVYTKTFWYAAFMLFKKILKKRLIIKVEGLFKSIRKRFHDLN